MADLIPLVNGQAYSYVDITVNILGVPLAGITAIEYEMKSEITGNYGAAPGKNLMNIPPFDIPVAYLPEGSAPTVDIIKNVKFKNMKSGGGEGDTNILQELELFTSHIEFDAI